MWETETEREGSLLCFSGTCYGVLYISHPFFKATSENKWLIGYIENGSIFITFDTKSFKKLIIYNAMII